VATKSSTQKLATPRHHESLLDFSFMLYQAHLLPPVLPAQRWLYSKVLVPQIIRASLAINSMSHDGNDERSEILACHRDRTGNLQ
jgi:hypothetical protein